MLKITAVNAIMRSIHDQFVNLPEGVKRQSDLRQKHYMRHYMREVYRKNHSQVTVTLTKTEHHRLKKAAQQSGRKLATFLRESAFAYIDNRYLVPKDIQQVLSSALREFRAIGNNINQLAKHANTQRQTSREALQQALQLMRQLEEQVIHFLSHPSKHGDQIDE